MANVMSMKDVNGSVSRSPFDLSRRNLFSAKISEKLPVAVVHCISGDKHRIKTKWMSRTVEVNTSAFTRIREHYNWYFVPYQQLWNKFNTFYTQMLDNIPVAEGIKETAILSDQHPYFTFGQIYNYINRQKLNSDAAGNFFGFNKAELSCKLLHYLGYGDYYDALTTPEMSSNITNVAMSPWALLAYQKIYYDHCRKSQWEKNNAPAFNINYMSGSRQIPIDDIDDLSIENMFDIHYSDWNDDMFMGLLPNSQFGDAATIFVSNQLDEPGYQYYTSQDTPAVRTVTFNEDEDFTSNIVLQPGGRVPMQYGTTDNFLMLQLSHAELTNLRAMLGFPVNGNLQSQFSVLSLRLAEAVQRLREIQQSHGQDYKSQVEARWHVKLSDAQSELCKWLGGTSATIDISEVVNTNLASEESEATIKGKGVGVGDDYIEFSTDLPGVLMCIYHAVPVLDYSISGINPFNLKTMWTDYAQPELDRTGMVSVPIVTLVNNKNVPQSVKNKLLGYAPRYYEYKTAIDEVHGSFYNGGDDNWIAPFTDLYISQYMSSLGGIAQTNSLLTYWFFKISPSIVNPIFAVNADSTVRTDQIKVNAFFEIYSVRNLDYDGLPSK